MRRGLTALLDGEPDLIVCAEAVTRREGIAALAATKPDLVIADLSPPDGDGLELVREIGSLPDGPPVLMLSLHDGPLQAPRAFVAGACGFVGKQEMTGTLLPGIRSVLRGERYGLSAGPALDG